MAKRGASSQRKQLWKPEKIDKKEAYRLIDDAREALRLLRESVKHGDRWAHMDYNRAFEDVESLYNILHMNELMQDTQQRRKEEREMLKREGLTNE